MKGRSALTERERAAFGPRDQKPVGSPEWCWQTLEYLKSRWAAKEFDAQIFSGVLAEVEAARAWEKVPTDRPYGSLDALLKAELGVGEREVKGALTNREKAQGAASMTRLEDKLSEGRPNKLGNLPSLSQAKRARRNGISESGQRRLDYLAAKRPDLHARISAGEMSVNAAWIEAGKEVRKIAIPLDSHKAAAAIQRHFTSDQIAEIVRLLH